MMAALHYARLYFFGIEEDRKTAPSKATKAPAKTAAGGHRHRKRAGSGLEFPGGSQVSGWDFVYFAFVIGMTAQTSDVGISAGEIRRFALLHSILSFFLNTVLLAAAVNIVVTLKP